MNAKKISLLLLATAGVSMLASCSKTVTRSDAETLLDSIGGVTSSQSAVVYTYASLKDSGNNYVISFDAASSYKHHKNTGTLTINSVATDSSYEAWMIKDGANYVVAYKDSSSSYYYSGTDLLVKAAIETSVSSYQSTINAISASTAKSISKYLKNFDDDGKVVSGGSVNSATILKNESYKSSGDGNLESAFTANYYGSYDEAMVYNWSDNLLTMISNDHNDNKQTYDWKSSIDKSYSSSWNSMSAAAAIVAVALI
ncbi:MAG: hypothetical protein LKF75_02250 [Bacilli bacterium]|jgi:hypothetical protein|nr:hypothetical protein [Bacilli bacterium]MCH4210979.1 hypothetical protein [Bacilli bacterium]MCH4228510.1 hypothetical protein [Bacilli bacterium]MCH4277792.1 hypothetical protein [Bacilli bacterium]MCI2054962.1 hypothetical protein [Bacilli bacterium]